MRYLFIDAECGDALFQHIADAFAVECGPDFKFDALPCGVSREVNGVDFAYKATEDGMRAISYSGEPAVWVTVDCQLPAWAGDGTTPTTSAFPFPTGITDEGYTSLAFVGAMILLFIIALAFIACYRRPESQPSSAKKSSTASVL